MSTKRKASETGGAAGKRRAADDVTETIEGGDDLLGIIDGLGGGEGNENDEDALQSALENGAAGLGDALGDDLEGQLEDGVDGIDEGDLGESEIADDDDEPQSEVGDDAVSEADEDVLLPSGLEESELTTATEVDLSKLDITAAQARKIAPLLCANEALTTIRCEGGELSVADLRDEDELEWDSEEYHDVEAIIIAEYMKTNTVLQRLDLARNSITDAGARALALALHLNSSLEYLNLESNVVAEKGGKALCEMVASNNRLSYLNISRNAISSTGQQELRDVWTKAHGGSQLGLHL